MSFQSGLSLLEVVVTLVLITLTTFLAGVAFPVVREQQALTQTRQQFTAAVRAAQIQALDEQRSAECLDRVGAGLRQQKLCSDIGVYVAEGELRTFADIQDNNLFDANDMPLGRSLLPATITAATPTTILFEATPPNVITYVNGDLIPLNQKATIVFRSPHRELSLTLSAYGLVE